MSKVLLLLAAALASSGCAALTASRTETLNVTSEPPGAEIRVNGAPAGHAPSLVEIERARPPVVQVALPGYTPQTCDTRMAPGTGYLVSDALLCIFLFPIGCIAFIDAGGAWNTLQQPGCYARLVPENGAPVQGFPVGPEQGYPPPQSYPPAQSYPPPQGYPPPPPPPTGSYPPPPPPGP